MKVTSSRERSATMWSSRGRSATGRSGSLGAITDDEGRTFDVPLSFLPKGQSYVRKYMLTDLGRTG